MGEIREKLKDFLDCLKLPSGIKSKELLNFFDTIFDSMTSQEKMKRRREIKDSIKSIIKKDIERLSGIDNNEINTNPFFLLSKTPELQRAILLKRESLLRVKKFQLSQNLINWLKKINIIDETDGYFTFFVSPYILPFYFCHDIKDDVAIEFAKELSEIIWKHLEYNIDPLITSVEFYGAGKKLYMKEERVIVFSTTSGIIIPEEYYGSNFSKEMGWHSTRASLINPLRRSYFDQGINHGLRNGVKVQYQYCEKTTKEVLKRCYETCPAEFKEKYKKECINILLRFLELSGFELSTGDFIVSEDIPNEFVSWKSWLTLSNINYVIISVRSQIAAQIVHGIVMKQEEFKRILLDFPSGKDARNVLMKQLLGYTQNLEDTSFSFTQKLYDTNYKKIWPAGDKTPKEMAQQIIVDLLK